MKRLVLAAILLLAPFGANGGTGGDSRPAPRFTITDLGTLGGAESVANAINERGQVTGTSDTAGGQQHAFLYSGGPLIDLSSQDSGFSYGNAINGRGQITGKVVSSGGLGRAFIYSGGPLRLLPSTQMGRKPVYANGSSGYGINDAGRVTGIAETGFGVSAFLYDGGRMRPLGAFGRYSKFNFGMAINEHGDIVGVGANSPGAPGHAFIYQNGSRADLGTLHAGMAGMGSVAWGINDAGQVVGTSNVDLDLGNGTHYGTNHAFLYCKGRMVDLGTLPNARDSEARAINGRGDIVGESGQRAFLYRAGGMWDLNDLLGPAGRHINDWWLTEARGINGRGQIVGVGLHMRPHGVNYFSASDRAEHAFLLTPLPSSVTEGRRARREPAGGPRVTLPLPLRERVYE